MILKKILFTAAMVAAFANAQAASTVPFGVAGTVTPGACSVGTSAIGALGSSTATAVKLLASIGTGTSAANTYAAQDLTFTVSCTAATKVGLQFTDNNPTKKVAIGDGNDAIRFAMYDAAAASTVTTGIGSMTMVFNTATSTLDGIAVAQYLVAANAATVATWSKASLVTGALVSTVVPGYETTFAKTAGNIVPDTFTTLVAHFTATAYINTASVTAATAAMTPTVSGTMSLVYL